MGPQGPTGPQGLMGFMGLTGPKGDPGPSILDTLNLKNITFSTDIQGNDYLIIPATNDSKQYTVPKNNNLDLLGNQIQNQGIAQGNGVNGYTVGGTQFQQPTLPIRFENSSSEPVPFMAQLNL
jgi:hypothetical protein